MYIARKDKDLGKELHIILKDSIRLVFARKIGVHSQNVFAQQVDLSENSCFTSRAFYNLLTFTVLLFSINYVITTGSDM